MKREKVIAKLPDPFALPEGGRISNSAQWEAQSGEKLRALVDLVYGGFPQAPETVRVRPMHTPGKGRMHTYVIEAANAGKALSFALTLNIPDCEGKCPVVLTGDGCYRNMNDSVVAEITARGMIAATFNRTELAADIKGVGRDHGVYRLYPGMTFGALSAWAWGYARCVDALLTLDFVNPDQIAITGHSRGGKTTLLAAAMTPQIAVVQANNSGAGGTASWRYRIDQDNPAADSLDRSERLGDLIRNFPFWFGPRLPDYVGREEALPFDQFLLETAIAPRKMLDTQGLADTWANPAGAMQTHLAARRVYSLYGAEENLRILYRQGGHGHGVIDFVALLDFMQGKPADDKHWSNPYEEMKPAFDW